MENENVKVHPTQPFMNVEIIKKYTQQMKSEPHVDVECENSFQIDQQRRIFLSECHHRFAAAALQGRTIRMSPAELSKITTYDVRTITTSFKASEADMKWPPNWSNVHFDNKNRDAWSGAIMDRSTSHPPPRTTTTVHGPKHGRDNAVLAPRYDHTGETSRVPNSQDSYKKVSSTDTHVIDIPSPPARPADIHVIDIPGEWHSKKSVTDLESQTHSSPTSVLGTLRGWFKGA